MPAQAQAALLAECGRLIDRATTWFLRNAEMPLDVRAETTLYGEGIAEMNGHLEEIVGNDQRRAQDHHDGVHGVRA